MSKICTSIEQSKKLLELGMDPNTADMRYRNWIIENGKYNNWKDENDEDVAISNKACEIICCDGAKDISEYLPAWSLSALLEWCKDKVEESDEEGSISFDSSAKYNWMAFAESTKYFLSTPSKDTPMDTVFDLVINILKTDKECENSETETSKED